MSIQSELNRYILANWNPSDDIDLRDLEAYCKENELTFTHSSILHAIQLVRDEFGTIKFRADKYDRKEKGKYFRLPFGLESEGTWRAVARQALHLIEGDFIVNRELQQMTARRLMRDSDLESFRPQILEDFRKLQSESAPNLLGDRVNERIGGGVLFQDVKNIWDSCAISGCRSIRLLKCVHIKPWDKCDANERCDRHNGLLLTPDIASQFSLGLITLDKNGNVRKSRLLQFLDVPQFKARDGIKRTLRELHEIYLDYHRNSVFIDGWD